MDITVHQALLPHSDPDASLPLYRDTLGRVAAAPRTRGARKLGVLVTAVALCAAGVVPAGAVTARQPEPPGRGAGSRDYRYPKVKVTGHGGFVLYEPAGRDEQGRAPARAPVVVYFHGFQTSDNRGFLGHLLRHLARKGSIVVYVKQGADARKYPANARTAIAAAKEVVGSDGHVAHDGRVGYVGFSLGGVVALRLAAQKEAPSGWRPGVVVLHDPAGEAFAAIGNPTIGGASLGHLPKATRLLLLQAATSARDPNSSVPVAWAKTPELPTRNWLRIPSDAHGAPPMVSNHDASGSGPDAVTRLVSPLDAVDWWGYRRPTDGALAVAFTRDRGSYNPFSAGCDPSSVRDMGTWSDGVPANKIQNASELTGDC